MICCSTQQTKNFSCNKATSCCFPFVSVSHLRQATHCTPKHITSASNLSFMQSHHNLFCQRKKAYMHSKKMLETIQEPKFRMKKKKRKTRIRHDAKSVTTTYSLISCACTDFPLQDSSDKLKSFQKFFSACSCNYQSQ